MVCTPRTTRSSRAIVAIAAIVGCWMATPSRASGPSVSTATYLVQLQAGGCAASAECTATLSVETKGGATLDPSQPLVFEAKQPWPRGLTYTKTPLKRVDGRFDEKKGTLPVGFTAAKAGKVWIGGTFSMSVCTASSCIMEKVDLALEVEVK